MFFCENGYIEPKLNCNAPIYLEGYFQSQLYFDDIKDDLLKLFSGRQFSEFFTYPGLEKIQNRNSVCISVKVEHAGLHASTQMSVSNHYGVKVLHDMGFQRVVLARELNYQEANAIKQICLESNDMSQMEIEVFIHGGLCIAYSGQCFSSSYCFGSSANRGRCLMTCWKGYELKAGKKVLERGSLLRPRDLEGLYGLKHLMEGEIDCLKIQGRLRNSNYIGEIVNVYRHDVLISCPSDVGEYVDSIKSAISRFNSTIGEYKDIVLRTRYWKDDSFAQSGGKAQELLNKQIVETSDLAVAVFWTKFGEPTEHYASGTEEEIETMISNGKQVFVYFLDKPISPSTLNSKEYKKIINFKKKYCGQGIYVTVKDEIKLESDILDGLTHYFAK